MYNNRGAVEGKHEEDNSGGVGHPGQAAQKQNKNKKEEKTPDLVFAV